MAIIKHEEVSIVRDYLAGPTAGDEITLNIKGYPVTDLQKSKGIYAKVGVKTPTQKEVIMTVQVLTCADAKYGGVILNAMSYSNGKDNIDRPFTQEFEMSVLKALHEHYVSDNDTLKELTTLAAAGTLSNQEFFKNRKARKATAASDALNAVTAEAIAAAVAAAANTATVGASSGDAPIQ